MLLAMFWLGCTTEPTTPETQPPSQPVVVQPAAPAPAPTTAPPSREVARVAIVREVIATDRYTFARMDACGAEAWVAGPVMPLEVGAAMGMPAGTPMTDFESVTLGRRFEQILFVDWLVPAEPPECAPPVMPTDKQRIGVVQEVFEAGGYTYARLDHCGTELWIAASVPAPPVGATVLTDLGSVMTDFTSPSVGRSFPSIVFVNRAVVVPGAPLCDAK